jgi:hypothetical protein
MIASRKRQLVQAIDGLVNPHFEGTCNHFIYSNV